MSALQDLNNLRDERTMLKAQMANQQNVVDDSKPDAGLLGQKEAALEGLLRDLEAAKKVSSELRENVTQLRIKIQDVKTTLVCICHLSDANHANSIFTSKTRTSSTIYRSNLTNLTCVIGRL